MLSQKVNDKIIELKEEMNRTFKQIQSMKIYSNNIPVNVVISKSKELSKGIRASAIAVYFALEGHSNNSSEVNVSQQTLANELGLSREYVNFLIGELHKINLIQKIRRGLKQVNQYILTARKNVKDIVDKIKEEIIKLKKDSKINHNNKNSNFNSFEQRNYNFENLEKVISGEESFSGSLSDYYQTE